MTPSNHASPFSPPESVTSPTPLRRPKTRISADSQSMTSSVASLPYRASNASVQSLFASTTTPSGSRPVSPTGGSSTPSRIAGSVFGGSTISESHLLPSDGKDDPRNLILSGFVPHIAVHTSIDTHELVQDKGFKGGLWELIRPFGEKIQGKVNYALFNWGMGLKYRMGYLGLEGVEGRVLSPNGSKSIPESIAAQRLRTGGDVPQIERLVDRHLTNAEEFPGVSAEDFLNLKDSSKVSGATSPFYTLYLRRLLSGIPLAPHETFSHPVACIIAISSRNKNPIEALRRLYEESSRGEKRLPLWVNDDYLRYYVLVHDEERDDITKSITLFEQMKRHFGLHCHLLRLRSSQCVATDDDSVQLPRCEWIAASEEMAEIQARESQEDPEDSFPCIYESDTTAIKTFIREMVTQSVVPSMERCVATWNDQVASRRRGISGRFMSLSKTIKWPGAFGSSSRSNSNSVGSGSNYDALQGFYRPDSPEALMRKLADYSFMLRDWKLAQQIYDLLRSDFTNDKAWKYHAAANEMAAVSTLMMPHSISAKTRTETIDMMLETSSYSYMTRCSAPYGALRCLTLGMELLRVRGGSATGDAARWGARLLEHKIVGAVGDSLFKERVAVCYGTKKGHGVGLWGSRTRKSAMWSIMAAEGWLSLEKPHQSRKSLDDARARYATLANKDSLLHFSEANEFVQGLEMQIENTLYPITESQATIMPDDDMIETTMGEESEAFNSRPHRRSLLGGVAPPPISSLESAPLHGALIEAEEKDKIVTSNDFEQE
ncbi:Transport protein particle subunit trs85-2 [Botrytis cinerea]